MKKFIINNKTMSWKHQISEIENDDYLYNYFENRNLKNFLINQIQLTFILENLYNDNPDKNPILTKLEDIQHSTENDTIKELLNIIKIQIEKPNILQKENLIKELSNSLDNNPTINNINYNLQLLQTNISGGNSSAKKGQISENILYNNLTQLLADSEVINTSHISNSGDIQIKKDNKPTILIDSKNFKNNVPSIDVEKFYKDLDINNCSGILCSSNSGIANRSNFEIDIKNNNIYIFISNHKYDNSLFKYAVDIIYNIHNIIKYKSNNIDLDKELFQRLKLEYNFFLSTFQEHLATIKTNILSLEKLSFIQLDHFFKRTNLTNQIKEFSCNICGKPFGSDKTLKSHQKLKH